MTFEHRNRPRAFADLVFHDEATRHLLAPLFHRATARNLLLHGEGGSGKSATCRVLAETLLGPDWYADITSINVSRTTSKAALCDRIVATNGFGAINEFGRNVVILEELDGADHSAQLALKCVLDERARFTLFLATTNDLDGIIEPLRDRFLEAEFAHPTPDDWSQRAVAILAAEGVKVTPAMALNLLRLKAPSGSMRDVMRELDLFASTVRSANQPMPRPTAAIASTPVSSNLPAVISATAQLAVSTMSPGETE